MARRLLRSHQGKRKAGHDRAHYVNPLMLPFKKKAKKSYVKQARKTSMLRLSKPRSRKHKVRKGIQKIGSYAGQLIASKRVTVPKAGARIRQRQFGSNMQQNRHWTTGSTMGSEQYYCSLLAEAVTTHILRECKDFRSTKTDSSSDVIGRIKLQFSAADQIVGTGLPRDLVIDLSNTSFDMIVYNASGTPPVPGTGPNTYTTASGVASGNDATLAAQFFLFAEKGFYPSAVYVYREIAADDYVEIYRDTQFGKAKVNMTIRSDFKFQNVTPGSGTSGNNINAIDANPLQGKIATFRNQSPTWNKGFLAHIDPNDAGALTNFSGRPIVTGVGSSGWDKVQTSNYTLPVITQLEAMPLRMTTVFGNAKTSTPVHFPPGGFKSYKTSFSYSGSIYKFLRDSTQPNDSTLVGKYPPLGDSFALCLVPTMKSLSDEPITVTFDFHRDGLCNIVKYRGATLPATNMFM